MSPLVVWGCAAFALSLSLTAVCRVVALRLGIVACPRDDRWKREEVPLLGGVALLGATALPALAAFPGNDRVLVLLAGAGLVCALGLVDDLRSIAPQTKLLGQILAAILVASMGLRLPLTGSDELDLLLTIGWIVALTNAFNLLDNMDGLAAGIAAIAAAYRLVFLRLDANWDGAALTAILLGATLGFLVHNRHPARIFMGDAGSMFLGFLVGGLSLAGGYPYSRGMTSILLLPVLLLLVPIFDTAFVTATRLLARRPVSVGGRDHTSHRLVALGLSERHAVWVLYGLAAVSGGVAYLSYRFGFSRSAVLILFLVLAVGMLAVHLSGVDVASSTEASTGASAPGLPLPAARVLFARSSSRQMATILFDFALVVAAYQTSYLLRFDGDLAAVQATLVRSMPLVVGCQLLALTLYRTHEPIWRFTSLWDLFRLAQAALAGTLLAVVGVVFAFRFDGFSRSVFVIDGILLVVFLSLSRVSFRLLTETLRGPASQARRVAIYGAGAGGELVLLALQRDPALGRTAVAFVDDDPAKRRRRLHSVPVIGGLEAIEKRLRSRSIDEVILASEKIPEKKLHELARLCAAHDVALLRASSMRLAPPLWLQPREHRPAESA